MSVDAHSEKFNIVSNDHGRTQKSNFAFQFVKPILQTITHRIRSSNTIDGFRDSVLVCKMHDCMIRKNFKHYGISIPSHQATQAFTTSGLDESKPLQDAI